MQDDNVPMAQLTLDSSTAVKLTMNSLMTKERTLMARNDAWHRIKVIKGARYDKEVILRSILLAVEPADLIPVKYQVNGEDAYFMARNCGAALEQLCRLNLIVNLDNGIPIILLITLGFASIHDLKINIQPVLLAVLRKRFNTQKKHLRLDNFHRDDDISKTVYCPLSQQRTLSRTLKLARSVLCPFEGLSLQNNELQSTIALANADLTHLKALDLRNNYLMTMADIEPLKFLNIKELWLDGNPLCENYANPVRYVESARSYCPNLVKLDGISINTPHLPVTYNNYFTNDNTRKIIHQFLDHFFSIYDHDDRLLLKNLYHRGSMFSMTLAKLPGQSIQMNLDAFIAENRSIIPLSDKVKEYQLLYCGPAEITDVFRRLPLSLHVWSSFKIDVLYEDRQTIVFSVDGMFKSSKLRLFAFSRTFRLLARGDDEYIILNDQYTVNTTIDVPLETLDSSSLEGSRNHNKQPPLSTKQKQHLIVTLMDATTMNVNWCYKYLENANWNARQAIKTFMEDYKMPIFPSEAFRTEEYK